MSHLFCSRNLQAPDGVSSAPVANVTPVSLYAALSSTSFLAAKYDALDRALTGIDTSSNHECKSGNQEHNSC